MRTLLLSLLFAFIFTAVPVASADELPEVAPTDEPAVPSLDEPASE